MRHSLLVVAVVAQLAVLSGEYLMSVYPLWFGTSVQLALEPVDPRSLFRGNFASLNYSISDLDGEQIVGDGKWWKGQIVYVSLAAEDGLHKAVAVSPDPPEEGLFIRGRVAAHHGEHSLRVEYNGINAYFAPEEKALALERAARRFGPRGSVSAFAEVRLTDGGRPALVQVDVGKPDTSAD
jgi:uncharacterized membrane-anchored protein